jgi:hypothetical protein
MTDQRRSPTPSLPPAKRALGCLFVGVGIVVLLVLVVVLAFVVWRAGGTRQVEALKAAARARGEPLTPEDLAAAYYAIPEGRENTTAMWQAALAVLDSAAFKQDAKDLPVVGAGPAKIPARGEPWPERAAVEALLEKYQAGVRGLHAAAARGGAVRFDRQFDRGIAMLLEDVMTLRTGARVLILEAHVRAHRGDAPGVAESLHTLNQLPGTLDHDPVMVSLLVRIAIGGMSTQLCRELLPQVEFSDEDLRRLAEDYRTLRYHEGLQRAILGERVFGLLAFEHPEALGGELPPGLGWNRDEDLALYLDLMEQAVAAAQQPFPQAQQEFRAVNQRLAAVTQGRFSRFRYVRTMLLVPALDAAAAAAARGDADSEGARTAIAIEQYRRQHGRWPDRLEQLVPDFLPQLPLDPYDGRTLRYVVQEDRYLLYSVGRDGVDNGGQGEYEPDFVMPVKR